MNLFPRLPLLPVLIGLLLFPSPALAQDQSTEPDQRPSLRIGQLQGAIRLDGLLTEEAWTRAPVIQDLTTTEPLEGGTPRARTLVRVLAEARVLVIGVEAKDPDPDGIVSTSKARDTELRSEDYLKIILDPFLDGRSGYIFAVNPGGARYDALVARRGEGEDPQWDAVWEAATARGPEGWSAEIRIPLQSLRFNGDLRRWGFNVERRVERLQEVSRWASPFRAAKISQTSRAGYLTDLPVFDTGVGLTVRPAVVAGVEKEGEDGDWEGSFEPSLDVFQRLGQNVTAMATVNTDFAETEVDTRKTNLTRFPLFFPEKRTFFLEGSDIFDFGVGMASPYFSDVVPFFSRRIGLYDGESVPLNAGGKISGRMGNTNFGGLVTRTGSVDGLVDAATMGAFRVQQNVLEESSVGVLGTFGDPTGAQGSYLLGLDATYQTSRLRGDKNFILGAWGLFTDRKGLTGDRWAFGGKIDYPNDIWDVALTYLRLGDGFDPALGFVPRKGIHKLSGGLNYRIYPRSRPWLRMANHQFRPTMIWSLDGEWESYRFFTAPINWRLESGDRIEINVSPEGERLEEPFEIDGVALKPGSYHYVRSRLEWEMARKRPVSGQLTWWFGTFYDGWLDQIEAEVQLRPSELIIFDLTATRNMGRLDAGDFDQQLYGIRILANFSSDLQLTSFIQYDDVTREVGINTRLRWTFNPLGELFVVHNYNIVDELDRWALDATQLLVKLQYAVRW